MDISVQNLCVTDRYGLEKGFAMIREAGFTAVDWSLDGDIDKTGLTEGKKELPYCVFAESLEAAKKRYDPELEAMRKAGLRPAQSHAVFPSRVEDFPEYTDYVIEIYKNTLRYCAHAGCPSTVIHGASRRYDRGGLSDAELFDENMKLFTALIPTAKETGVMILLENLFTRYNRAYIFAGTCSDPYEACDYIDRLNALAGKECFGLCLDTGHLNLIRRLPRQYIDVVGGRIKALHLNDNNTQNDDHRSPYSGNVKWDEVCDGLRAAGYDGDLNFETFSQIRADVPERAAAAYLRAIYECGAYFRERILGK